MRTVLLILGIWTGVAFALVGGWVLVINLARRHRWRRDTGYTRDAAAAGHSVRPERDEDALPSAPGPTSAAGHAPAPSTSWEAEPHVPPTQAVVRAWTEPGVDPQRHTEAQLVVRRAIPDLAHALDRLAEESRHRRSS
ncbi:hypothetical protein [Phytoactinopolyspora halotolerans]|uniref:Uncharacterized protein n=1 Tax=Phytoactinopolyspora halotolerans TaxID=1981512 RepID=A0A6L9SCU8_9ACTN|nr:hypothetical protein [Phytoactinopolyspora halotolerans]NEE02907.1 hypothetical protein [Phytoactinopolyspora halotolerans]